MVPSVRNLIASMFTKIRQGNGDAAGRLPKKAELRAMNSSPVARPPHPALPWVLLVLLGAVWGTSFILMKRALFASDGEPLLHPASVAGLRMALAGTVMAPVAWRLRREVPRSEMHWAAIVGLVGSFIPAFLFATAQTQIPSSLAGILNALSPLFTTLIAVVLFRNPIRGVQVTGLLIGFAGAAWLVSRQGLADGAVAWGPSLLLVLATFCYGISVNTTREKLQGRNSIAVAAFSLAFVAIPGWIAVGLSGTHERLMAHPEAPRALGALLVLSLVGTAASLAVFNFVIAWTNAVIASSVTYIIPLFAALWGIHDGEPLTWIHAAAGACILAGVWLVSQGNRRPVAKGEAGP